MLNPILSIASLILFLAAPCAMPSLAPTLMPTPTPSPVLSPYDDSANLAIHPDIETVVIGQVLEKLGSEIVPLTYSPNSVRYGYWLVKVDKYLVDPFPYPVLKVRLIEEFIRPDGSTAHVLYPLPVLMPRGEAGVFFLSRYSARGETPLTGDTFTLRIGPLGHETQRIIRDGEVHTVRKDTPGWEPLEHFVARVVHLASQAGRATEEQSPEQNRMN